LRPPRDRLFEGRIAARPDALIAGFGYSGRVGPE